MSEHSAQKDAPVRLDNACACGDCYHPASGRAADGDPFWNFCRDCGCPSADHTRMTTVISTPTIARSGDRDPGAVPVSEKVEA